MPFGPSLLLLDPQFGSDPEWEETYFTSVTEPQMRSWIGGAAQPHRRGRLALAPDAAVWLVASECSAEEMSGLRGWFGRADSGTLFWDSPPSWDHAGIGITRYVPGRPIDAPVLLAPRAQ
jgi:hypothetical protein